jgi:uncharacterized repeat protein (TIGR01451 family)
MGRVKQSGKSGVLGKGGMLAAVSAAGLLGGPAFAAGTPAGTNIENVATATYELPGGAEGSVDSNIVTLMVDELLDVTVTWADSADVVGAPGATGQVLRFTLTNGGNGSERFTLAAVSNGGGDDFDPAAVSLVLDANGNDAYDAGIDTLYVAGSNDPELAPDQTLSVFVVSTIPGAALDGQRGRIDLTAAAGTGTGAPGTSFAGLGQGGGNAVVGSTGADAGDDGWYKAAKASINFVKSATVADPYGGATQGPGATVTYTLTASATGTGSLANVRITDAIPAGTTYAPGSLTLEGAALTDADDADAGRFSGSAVAVALGSLASGSSRTVTFKVKID